jgi:hypothetical protein
MSVVALSMIVVETASCSGETCGSCSNGWRGLCALLWPHLLFFNAYCLQMQTRENQVVQPSLFGVIGLGCPYGYEALMSLGLSLPDASVGAYVEGESDLESFRSYLWQAKSVQKHMGIPALPSYHLG